MFLHVVVPTYNEGRNIAELLAAIDGQASSIADLAGYRVIHVDDGSLDDTVARAKASTPGMALEQIAHAGNLGIGATFRDGLSAALDGATDGDGIILIEGDLTNDPALIPGIVSSLRAGADVVIASRYRRGSAQPGFPLRRRLLSHGLNRFLRWFHPIPGVTDYSIFFRGYRAGLLRRAWAAYGPGFIRCHGFGANAEILCRLRPFGPRVEEIPQVYRYDRAHGNSGLRIYPTIREYLRLFSVLRSIARVPAPGDEAPDRDPLG